MNERIQELIQQAMVLDDDDGGLCLREEFDREKFAKLIIDRCAAIAQYFYTRNECVSGRDIKEHFGVEE